MKASQLESTKQILEEIENQRQISKTIIREKESNMPRLEEELFQLEEQYKKCISVEVLRKKLNNLMHECSWSLVISFEKRLEETKKENLVVIKSKDKCEKKLQETKQVLAEATTVFEQMKAKIGDISKITKTLEVNFEAANEVFKKAMQQYKQFGNELKKLNFLYEKKSKEQAALEEKLNEEKHNTQKDYEEERKQKEAKIRSIRAELEKNENLEKFKFKDNQMYSSGIEHAQGQIREKTFNCSNFEKTIRNFQSDVDNLKNAAGNMIYKFGDTMPALVDDVKQSFENGNFKELPRGPIGMYIKPKDHQYSLAIEQCLGALICSFICGNYEDEKTLQKLINKHIHLSHKKPKVIVTDFRNPLYDVSRFVSK